MRERARGGEPHRTWRQRGWSLLQRPRPPADPPPTMRRPDTVPLDSVCVGVSAAAGEAGTERLDGPISPAALQRRLPGSEEPHRAGRERGRARGGGRVGAGAAIGRAVPQQRRAHQPRPRPNRHANLGRHQRRVVRSELLRSVEHAHPATPAHRARRARRTNLRPAAAAAKARHGRQVSGRVLDEAGQQRLAARVPAPADDDAGGGGAKQKEKQQHRAGRPARGGRHREPPHDGDGQRVGGGSLG
mmetsp:Transcript_5706/g.18143  ORF Transcript_5706/g.18143 Transcript_5706/m.18143 type:complete len:245 (-) Transcript_5706:6703-7437(-)